MHAVLSSAELRPWAPNDAESLARYANDRAIWRSLRDGFPHPYRLEDAERFLVKAPPTYLCIAREGEAIGGIGLTRNEDVERFSAELGYWIGGPFWGLGIATEAIAAITAWGFAELQLQRIYAMPYAHNRASSRVLEKCGFVLEGRLKRSAFKDGSFVDQYLYARLAGAPAPPPRHALTILAVPDLNRAVTFYRTALSWPLTVETEVYVELAHPDGQRLGLYLCEAFSRNTGRAVTAISEGGTASTELYLYAADLARAIMAIEEAGGHCLSARKIRPWGDEAAYYLDPFGHVVALAREAPR